MKKECKINNVDDDHYIVEDILDGQVYSIYITFFEKDHLPKKGDSICLSEKYLKKNPNEYFCFGGLSEIYGKDVSNENLDESEEIIIIKQRNNKKTYLKRFYG